MSINYKKYVPLIKKIIGKYNKMYQEDMYQECFLKLFEISKKFNDDEKMFERYAARTLKYVCIDYINKNSLNHASLDELISDEDGNEYTKAELIEDELDMDSYLEAKDYINNLSTDEARIKELYYLHGYTMQEIVDNFPECGVNSTSTLSRMLKIKQ